MCRIVLKKARKDADLTQEGLAEKLGISPRMYAFIEAGERNGDFTVWDGLEDLFNLHQRKLREIHASQNLLQDSQ